MTGRAPTAPSRFTGTGSNGSPAAEVAVRGPFYLVAACTSGGSSWGRTRPRRGLTSSRTRSPPSGCKAVLDDFNRDRDPSVLAAAFLLAEPARPRTGDPAEDLLTRLGSA